MKPDNFDGARQIMHRLVRVIGKLETVEMEIDQIHCELEAFLGRPERALAPARRLAQKDAVEAIRKRDLLEQAREQYAASGATELKLAALPTGAFSILIDGQHRLKLPPQLAALLQVLARAGGTSPDSLVPWKSRLLLRGVLGTAAGRLLSNHALTQLVSRLRKELRLQANLHRNFVMVHPVHGLRFALQQKAQRNEYLPLPVGGGPPTSDAALSASLPREGRGPVEADGGSD